MFSFRRCLTLNVIKNWALLELGPELAMLRMPRPSCSKRLPHHKSNTENAMIRGKGPVWEVMAIGRRSATAHPFPFLVAP